jgi:hypothetical protein
MEQIDNVTRWAESGLLNGVDDPQNAKDLADTLEMMARHLVAMSMWQVREEEQDIGADSIVFPIVRKIMSLNGYKRLRNYRDLFREVETQWRDFDRSKYENSIDAEAEFIDSFSENNKDKFISPHSEVKELTVDDVRKMIDASMARQNVNKLLSRALDMMLKLPHVSDCKASGTSIGGCTCGRDALIVDIAKYNETT